MPKPTRDTSPTQGRPPTTPWGRPHAASEAKNAWGRPLTPEQQQAAAAARERAAREQKALASIVESRMKLGDTLEQASQYAREYAAEQHRTNDEASAALSIGWHAESLSKKAREAAKPPAARVRTAKQVLDEHRRTRPATPGNRRIINNN